VRRACIDIGSNTTRLLVAECDGPRLLEVHQERAFTRIGRGLDPDGAISTGKIAEVAEVVAEQVRIAGELGSVAVHGVALVAAIREASGLAVAILSGAEEARLAFVGAARTLGRSPAGALGVVDVGGGSSELVVGAAPDKISWSSSVQLGSGDLAAEFLLSDPPSAAELDRARAHVAAVFNGLEVPRPAEAVAVGGSAASLQRVAGPLLDADGFRRAHELLAAGRATELARRFALDRERVRLLPAGLLILQAASELFGVALEIGRGGIREGVLLEAAAL
jgi:exopolyphosphatase/guanosine-5'-triphosphate,3'-diphosphate pyrophosphatase